METFWASVAAANMGGTVLAVVLWRLAEQKFREERVAKDDYRRKWLQLSGAEQYLEPGPDHLYPRRRQ